MPDLADLYQQVIIEHNRSPRNYRVLPDANRTAEGDNPLCGDRLTLYLKVNGDTIEDVGFQGRGCAISQASASLMTAAVQGKRVAEAQALFDAVHAMLTGSGTPDPGRLGKLAALAGVRQFPARVKCASLSWHTLRAALEGRAARVTTDDPRT
ncbi:MAG TPA: SUF system NifU family Fe-S cluster assembly protein [Gemmatimonadales bacterium]|nr:SUF system NifU family Fe-S cluster assembly protein [Gemmatimonadales bacterium]